ncbi:Hypothetical protein KQS_01330 [Flavobacterium indicum GPTSA100-9 = DSM 17447]|uniref:Uncharacterized protein n=1 Tax=Flavobacterium indicum (strain DSM 17447 / CIP 109464 / GPTSA100-9) TaxID=1094466 RepID=H8XNZ4_FLAIG|nr:hypothetical protein [Flavobacterium indicum]CCG52261.1 Hypothetical protein KQS_01330 [Flavobacterium indicum GPTSA100-9 = DSM 17447]
MENINFKNRIISIQPENGLELDESFLIRIEPEHHRGGINKKSKILITNTFEFYCLINLNEHGVKSGFNFYLSGNIPFHLKTYFEKINSDSIFLELSYQIFEIAKLNRYNGVFDISFKKENEFQTHYINFDILENNILLNFENSIFENEKEFKEWINSFSNDLYTWIDSLNTNYIDLLQKGIFSFEIEYD